MGKKLAKNKKYVKCKKILKNLKNIMIREKLCKKRQFV